MSNDRKKSVMDALQNFSRRAAHIPKKRAKRNEKPEKEVEMSCVAWMRAVGWSVDIYEAKATWNPKVGAWLNQGMKAGTVDCIGCMNDGHAVFVEFKALGRLTTFNADRNHRQKEFLIEKIKKGAFGCVVDSSERLQQIHIGWLSSGRSIAYLLDQLP